MLVHHNWEKSIYIYFFAFWQNLTDDECSEDKMNNLQFYLNKFPSAPDGNMCLDILSFQCLGKS